MAELTADDLRTLARSWELHLRAERKSRETLKSYLAGVQQFFAWCEANDTAPTLTRAPVNAWIADLLDGGAEASTARARQLAVRRFSAWLVDEDELPRDELLGIKPPKLDVKVVDPLSDEQCRALLKSCAGKEFRDHRDAAIVQFMLETGTRASETINMTVTGTNVSTGSALIVRGKGGKGRTVPFSAQCGTLVDRYLRKRRTHRLADTDQLWLGDRGKGFAYYGLYSALSYRAELADITDFHPHRMRHTGATRWLAAGGSEGGLMAVFGWSRRDMIDRYTKATASERAAAEARRLNLGDL